MGKYKTYNKYKNSGISWLCKIPEHWNQTYIKDVTNTYSKKGMPEAELLSVYRDFGVIKKNSRDDNHNKPGMDLSGYKVVYPNTLVINKMKTWSGSLGVSKYLGIVSPAYITCNIDLKKVDINYFNYLLRCKNYIFEYNRLSYGVRPSQWDMRYQDFKSIPIYLPTPEEQTAIAQFLDYKLAKINRFIKKKKQLIKLLNEQKAAIINQAVTKGLDPNVKMKDSGIEWLGEIPEHWEVKQLKHLLKPNGLIRGPFGSSLKTSFFVKSGYKVYEQKNSIYKDLKLGTSYIDELKFNELRRFEVCEGDFLMSCSGTIGKIHKVFGAFEKGIINQALMIIRIKENELNTDHFYWLFESNYLKSRIQDNSKGSAMKNIVGINEFKSLLIPLPSKDDQKKISTYLTEETKVIDKIISTIEKEIALVEEYKTTLISEAVTGKIDVRGFVVPEAENEAESYEEQEIEMSLAAEYEDEYEINETE